MDNLRKHVIVVDRCCMCKRNGVLGPSSFPLRFLGLYGMFSLVDLSYLGLCLDELLTNTRVGGLLVVLRVLLCER
jgi:hypothetical protein